MSAAVLSNRQSQVVAEILARLDNLPDSADANRRTRQRVAVRLPLCVSLFTAPELPQITVHTRNVSTAGAGFLSQRVFKIHERVVLHLACPGFPGKLILCEVRFCRYLRSGLYEVGVAFEEAVAYSSEHCVIPHQWMIRANPDGPLMI